jgi:tyrosinase
MHGEYVNPQTAWYPKPAAFPGWSFIKLSPNVPTTPLPSQADQDLFWNQCQHGTWYFLPWHRGYLISLEAQLRKDIISLSGPADWALPYWSYFGGANGSQYVMPPAFAAQTLPDGSANFLYVALRYGPDGDENIYVPTPDGEAAHPGDPNFAPGDVTLDCMTSRLFTTTSPPTAPGFGGANTGFLHGGQNHGNLETNPHDQVHGFVGSFPTPPQGSIQGLMAIPNTAALDPIFYLHHANIDRLWAGWNTNGNFNPPNADWLSGPTTRKFVMPGGAGNQPWYYTPNQVDNLDKLNYIYEELPPPPAPAPAELVMRLNSLGATDAAEKAKIEPQSSALPMLTELIGANEGPLRIEGSTTRTLVRLDTLVRRKVMASLVHPSEISPPDHVFIKLENVRGDFDAAAFGVYINLPEGAKPRNSPEFLAGTVSLFGLHLASIEDGPHSGEGLTFLLDATHIIDHLHLSRQLDVGSLRVSLVTTRELPPEAKITVGRVSLYRASSTP